MGRGKSYVKLKKVLNEKYRNKWMKKKNGESL